MAVPIQNKGNKNGASNYRYSNRTDKERSFNGNLPPFGNQAIMWPRVPFRGGEHPLMPPIRGWRPPLRGRPIPGPSAHMGPRPRGLSPYMYPPPPGMHPTFPDMSLAPPPMIMGRPPLPPAICGSFRSESSGKGQFQTNFGGVNTKNKVIKENRPYTKNIDLTKSWVTDVIKAEFIKKDELLSTAKSSQNQEDWAIYREQREKCYKIYHAAEMELIGQQETCTNVEHSEQGTFGQHTSQPHQPYQYLNNECTDNTSKMWACDNCEKDFSSEIIYKRHIQEHKVCNIDGCTFTAHEKIIQKHIKMQHSTGLYNRIRNINTPEDVMNWIEERKMRHPSARKYIQKAEVTNENTRSTKKIKNHRFKTITKRYKSKKLSGVKRNHSLLNEENRLEYLTFSFKGTRELYMEELIEEKCIYDDEQWTSGSGGVVTLNNALQDLIGAYVTDDEEEKPICNNSNNTFQNRMCDVKEVKDDNFPLECQINRTPFNDRLQQNINMKEGGSSISKSKCISKNSKKESIKRFTSRNKDKNSNRFIKQHGVLPKRLLANQLKVERHILLQCVHFVVKRLLANQLNVERHTLLQCIHFIVNKSLCG